MELKTIRVKAVMSNYNSLVAFILEQVKGIDQPHFQHEIELVSEELIVNVISYAYGEGEGDITVECGIDMDAKYFQLTLRDNGIPFNPLEKELPDLSVHFLQREIGGLGIFMVKKLTAAQQYTYENGENTLTVVKYF